ncbi:hypothetical protein BX661DRAFT_52700 [Kickxella alabastrina]|uniref:uncharacterized protein n=1 Tax=Kickxella alabastrina TaxID=61397 RepID=UPI002220AC8F|nr:uncharacterized protein BX661DRAFT_52700 [Kickxella alabastrina]KAI7823909.1 hypothetical protein BX661DRAFT_52700 [Kickxella alabastrina]
MHTAWLIKHWMPRTCSLSVTALTLIFAHPFLAPWVFSWYFRQAGKQGMVVNVAVMAGLVFSKEGEVFATMNAGLIHFTEASRIQKDNARWCALAPYYVDGLVDGGGGGRMLPRNKLGAELAIICEQVVQAVVRCIFDDRLNGKTVLMAGESTYTHTWTYLLARVHIFFIIMWSILVLLSNRSMFCASTM